MARRLRRRTDSARVFPLRKEGVRPLREEDLPLVFLSHNDRRFLKSFLEHYRALGVTRFLCVDDGSTDGTREALLAEPDVDVFGSDVRYREARRGRLWREALFEIHGGNRWYLNVDSDEYLVYQDCEERRLPDFIAELRKRGLWRCPAPMLDAYPARLEGARFDGDTDAMPWEVASLIDAEGYRLEKTARALSVRGGMRARLFNSDAELMKYPLLHWQRGCNLGISIHQPAPYKLNFAPILGALLHFKFFSDAAEMAREAVADAQYFDGSREYKRVAAVLDDSEDIQLACDHSFRYAGSDDLAARGFFESV